MARLHSNPLVGMESHFRFGENWLNYSKWINEKAVVEAVSGLQRLVGVEIERKRILDIGCGSGIHALAALQLGASEVQGIDLDPESVAAARSVLTRYALAMPWSIEEKSVFELDPLQYGLFDIVYSWGVLHHTGDMMRAIRSAARMVAPGGLFVFALYRKTWLCPFWKREKRWYAYATRKKQERARRIYTALIRLDCCARGRSFASHVADYRRNRGMDFYHDMHDWLGGWPYESISAAEVTPLMTGLGFEPVLSHVTTGRVFLGGRNLGLFGSGCDEYVYRRK